MITPRLGSIRRGAGLGLAATLALGLLAAPATASEVRAAEPDLTIVTAARYDVQPDQHRVRVNLTMVLTNTLRDTVTKRYYFDRAFLSVLPDTSGYSLSWEGGGSPTVAVSKQTADYTLLRLDLGERLFSGQSATYNLRFDLVDPGGEPTRDVRIGEALVAFPVWAFATDGTPGSTVKVVFPAGFEVRAQTGEIPEPTIIADGRVVIQTGRIDKPLTHFVYLVGDRPGAYTERHDSVVVDGEPVAITIRAWPDDPDWAERVGSLVRRALPVLSAEIGLGWPRDGGLVVEEAASRSTGGYAGLFDPKEGRVEVAWYAEDFVVLHEAAHAWFNGTLLADRWASEGFASYYGLEAAADLGVAASGDTMTPELQKARIPLNAWGPVGREATATEDYAYAATLAVAKAIAVRAGPDVLRAVWADAAARVGAYQPPNAGTGARGAGAAGAGAGAAGATAAGATGAPETIDRPPDWRGLLDLLETYDTDAYDDLWRLWVVRDSDKPLLLARDAARRGYEDLLVAARDWQLPVSVRDALRAWQFEQASQLFARAHRILDQREAIGAAAASAGLVPPPTLRGVFELPDAFATADREATAELEVIATYVDAAATRPGEPNPFQIMGLWGTMPDADLDTARVRFAIADLVGSSHAARAAARVWTSAEDVGRGRFISIVALALALVIAMVLVAGWFRARRRQRRRFGARWVGPASYGTLAATLEPPPPPVVADDGESGADLRR